MRLTADFIKASLSYNNPLNERELSLRGHKIPAIENLGIAKDHDAIDLTDNSLSVLGNFPLFPRLSTLLCARNRIATLAPTLPRSLPNLTTLVLEGNRLTELSDLEVLNGFKRLTHIVLIGCPVCTKEHYRAWVIWVSASVRVLDYAKVRDSEREAARQLFGSRDNPSQLARSIISAKSRAALTGGGADGGADDADLDVTIPGNATEVAGRVEDDLSAVGRLKLTEKEKRIVQKRIRNAKTMQEVTMLERALNEGRIPRKLLEDEDDNEMGG